MIISNKFIGYIKKFIENNFEFVLGSRSDFVTWQGWAPYAGNGKLGTKADLGKLTVAYTY